MASELERKRNKVDDEPKLRTRAEEDRLSSLPDELIHYILSFIGTKYAVQTCVLSSRWKHIWTTIPHLNLLSSEFRSLPIFSKFVNWVLSYRDNCTDVSNVDFSFSGKLRQKFVEKFLSYVIYHNVQDLKIFFPCPMGDDQLPPCLFNSKSLKYLSLTTNSIERIAYPCSQSPWNFPALTTLHLKNIWLWYEETSSLDLFSKCVNLKSLTLDDCCAKYLGVFHISCPKLVNLTIKGRWLTSKVALSTPNLSYFSYSHRSEITLSTGGLHYLESVNLETCMPYIPYHGYKQRDAHRLVSMLQVLRSAKNLTLQWNIIECLSAVPDIFDHQLSPLSNLKCLKIKFYLMWKSTDAAVMVQVIKYLFNSSSKFNVIMELSEGLSSTPCASASDGSRASQRRTLEVLCEVADMLSLREMSDPRIRHEFEDTKKKLAGHLEE